MPIKLNTAVIILNYFGADDTFECVQSVRANAPGCTFYLVDNSADQAEQQRVGDLFRDSADLKLLFPPENLGFAAGVNLALRAAVNEGFTRFLLLNNDATLLADSGLVLERAFQAHPASLIAPTILWGNDLCQGNYYHRYLGLITTKPLWQSRNFLFYLTGCAIAFDKSALDKTGYLDESFFMYGEDVAFSYQAHKNMVPVILLAERLVSHHGSKSAKRASFFYEYHLNRSHLLLTFRLVDCFSCAILALPGKTFMMGLRAVYRTIKYLTPAPLLAFLAAPFALPVRPGKKP